MRACGSHGSRSSGAGGAPSGSRPTATHGRGGCAAPRAIALLVLGLAFAPSGADTARPDLSGNWQLDKELSDDPRAKIREAIEARRAAGGGGSRAGQPGGFRRLSELRRRMEQLEQGMQRLTISQSAAEVVIRNADDREQKLVPDGQSRIREGGFGPVETRAEWTSGGLVVTDRGQGGGTVSRTYAFKPTDPHLHVMLRIEGRGPAIDYHQVYARVGNDP